MFTHLHHNQAFKSGEARLLQVDDVPAPAPLGDLTKGLEIPKAANPETIGTPRDLAKGIAEQLVEWEKLDRDSQTEILTRIKDLIAKNPGVEHGAVQTEQGMLSLKNIQLEFQKELERQGYAKKVEGFDGKDRFEERENSSRVSQLLEDRSQELGKGKRRNRDGSVTELPLYAHMQIEKQPNGSAIVIFTNGHEMPLSELLESLKDPKKGFRAVDIDYIQDRVRAALREQRTQERYSLKAEQDRLENHQRVVMQALERNKYRPAYHRMGPDQIAKVKEKINGVFEVDAKGEQKLVKPGLKQQIEKNEKQIAMNEKVQVSFRENLQDLKRVKRQHVAGSSIEREAMRQRAQEKSRDFLLRGGHHILKEEGVEIAPGMYSTVSVTPSGAENVPYKLRACDAVNKVALDLLKRHGQAIDDAQDRVSKFLGKSENWKGDTSVIDIIEKRFGILKELQVSGNRVGVRLRPRFYDPSSGKEIHTSNPYKISPGEIPAGGIVIDEQLAWEVVDRTIEDSEGKSMITLKEEEALRQLGRILESGRPSAAMVEEQVKRSNEGDIDPKTREAIPLKIIKFPYPILTPEVARALAGFKGNFIEFTGLNKVSPQALHELAILWSKSERTLIFGKGFPILTEPAIAQELRRFEGTLEFKGLEDEPYQDKYRPALEALSYKLRELTIKEVVSRDEEGGVLYNIRGLHHTMYKAMGDLKADRGEAEHHKGYASEGYRPMPNSSEGSIINEPKVKRAKEEEQREQSKIDEKKSEKEKMDDKKEDEKKEEPKKEDEEKETKQMTKVLNRRIALEFVETPMGDIVDYLRDYTGASFTIDKAALEEEGINVDTPMTINLLKIIPTRSALSNFLNPYNLTYRVKGDIIEITSKLAAGEQKDMEEKELSFFEEEIVTNLRQYERLNFTNTPLSDVRDFLRDVTSANIFLDQVALEEKGINADTLITLKDEGKPLEEALHSVLQSLGLDYALNHDVLWITSKDRIDSGEIKNKLPASK